MSTDGTRSGNSQWEATCRWYFAAYLYYVQSPWQLPLFYVSALGIPTGTNIIFTDVVPVVALVGKLIHSLTGAIVNPYGGFLFLCFVLPGVMMTLVLIATRTRYALAAVIGAIFADAMPALLWRWGDIALEAQFLLIGALVLYLYSLRIARWDGLAAAWIAYLAVAYLTNIYLFVMVGIVWLSAVQQRQRNGQATVREALFTRILTVTAIAILIALGGQFGTGGGLPFAEYGYYSMNLLSPFVPQASGVVPGMRGIIDATGGQYEGFNYLGLGLLLASLFVLPAEAHWLRRNARRHLALLIACAALRCWRSRFPIACLLAIGWLRHCRCRSSRCSGYFAPVAAFSGSLAMPKSLSCWCSPSAAADLGSLSACWAPRSSNSPM